MTKNLALEQSPLENNSTDHVGIKKSFQTPGFRKSRLISRGGESALADNISVYSDELSGRP
jgi:hypothetical protein